MCPPRARQLNSHIQHRGGIRHSRDPKTVVFGPDDDDESPELLR